MRCFMGSSASIIWDQIHKNEMGTVSAMDMEKRRAQEVIVGKPEGRSRHRWEDIIMDLKETRQEEMTWIDLDQDRDK